MNIISIKYIFKNVNKYHHIISSYNIYDFYEYDWVQIIINKRENINFLFNFRIYNLWLQ